MSHTLTIDDVIQTCQSRRKERESVPCAPTESGSWARICKDGVPSSLIKLKLGTCVIQKYREIPHAQEQNLDETGIISVLWVNMGQLFLSFQVLRQVIADDIFLGKSHPKRFAAKPFFKATARRGPKANSQVGGRNVYSLI